MNKVLISKDGILYESGTEKKEGQEDLVQLIEGTQPIEEIEEPDEEAPTIKESYQKLPNLPNQLTESVDLNLKSANDYLADIFFVKDHQVTYRNHA